MTEDDWKSTEELLRTWLRRTRYSQHSHHEAGKRLKRFNYLLAVPIVVITTALGTAALATITTKVNDAGKLTFGVLSLIAAVLAALQTHLAWAERSERHKTLGAKYGDIRRDIEEILALPVNERGAQKKVMDKIRTDLDGISGEGDVVPRRVFEKTRRRLAQEDAKTAVKT